MYLTLLTQYYPPEIGAPQARLSELGAHFIGRGHSVTVLTAMPNYPKGKIHAGYGGVLLREKQNGANVIRTFIYPTQKANFVPRMANYLSFVLSSSIVGSTQLRHTDYLLVESPPLFLGLAAMWLSALKRARMIFNVSDLWPESAVRLGVLKEDSLAFRLSEKLESYCYRRAWLVTGQSKTILADINDRFPRCSTFHLSNGVDTSKFCPERRSNRTRALLTPDRRLVVLYAGLHGLAQGLDQALEAAEAVQDLNFQFVLIGDGGFHYNPVPSCLGLAQEYQLPITVVVFNNQRYLSMERGLLRYYPEGASKQTGIHFGGPILPNPDYRHFAEVYGGYGVRVTDPKDIQAAVAQSLEHNRAGRLAVIDVVLSDYLPR